MGRLRETAFEGGGKFVLGESTPLLKECVIRGQIRPHSPVMGKTMPGASRKARLVRHRGGRRRADTFRTASRDFLLGCSGGRGG